MSTPAKYNLLERRARDDLLIVPTLLEQKSAARLGLKWDYTPRPMTPMMSALACSTAGTQFLTTEIDAMLQRVREGTAPMQQLLSELGAWFRAGEGSRYSANAIIYAIAERTKTHPNEIPDLVKWADATPLEMEKAARAVQLTSVAVRTRNSSLLSLVLSQCPYAVTFQTALHSSIVAGWPEGSQQTCLKLRDHQSELVSLVCDDFSVMRSPDGVHIFNNSQRQALRTAATKVYTMQMSPSDGINVIHRCAIQATAQGQLLAPPKNSIGAPLAAPAMERENEPQLPL